MINVYHMRPILLFPLKSTYSKSYYKFSIDIYEGSYRQVSKLHARFEYLIFFVYRTTKLFTWNILNLSLLNILVFKVFRKFQIYHSKLPNNQMHEHFPLSYVHVFICTNLKEFSCSDWSKLYARFLQLLKRIQKISPPPKKKM